MKTDIQTYRLKLEPLQAVIWDGKNVIPVLSLAMKSNGYINATFVDENQEILCIETINNRLELYIGEILILSASGDIMKMSEGYFDDLYERIN